MNGFKKMYHDMKTALVDETNRIKIQFSVVYFTLMLVAFIMSIINFFTRRNYLMASTIIFGVLCGINAVLAKRSEKALRISEWVFCAELLMLLTFFIISGTPEGFSAIWACLVPTCGLFLFGRKRGTILSAVMFLIIVFFLCTPIGQGFLQYQYTESFLLRFPVLYLAFFAVSFLLETIRSITNDELIKSRKEYAYLYRHDALTGIYNRYGFNEKMDEIVKSTENENISLMILDIDRFKDVNDQYGHDVGDIVLKKTADTITKIAGEDACVCRWGGEEFAVLYHGREDMQECGKRILGAIRDTAIDANDRKIYITASIGVAVNNAGKKAEPAALVRAADRNLYAAKDAGRNVLICHQIDSPEIIASGQGR